VADGSVLFAKIAAMLLLDDVAKPASKPGFVVSPGGYK
jgi:hypothetical protein